MSNVNGRERADQGEPNVNILPAAGAAALALAGAATAQAEVKRAPFGTLADGRAVESVTLTNGKGVTARIISYGAILQSVEAPDRTGKIAEITLGYDSIDGYLKAPNYFGATVGRYANRIANGRFAIDGKTYTLAQNNGVNALHGGKVGFDKVLWRIVAVKDGPAPAVTLAYTAADGEEGYPGKLDVTATYTLGADNALTVEYKATTDKPTIVNITNHSFFNLWGEASGKQIVSHVLTMPAAQFTPVGETLIPTGERRSVANTPFDFRAPRVIGDRIRDGRDDQIRIGQGYDHNYILGAPDAKGMRLAARVEEPGTGRVMEVSTNQPGVQFYTGNFLDGTAIGRSGLAYRQSDGLALEPQVFPDTPNQPALGSARLDPGQTYRSVIVYRFSTSAR
ncbi:aldose epimerase family protein [Sphingomonas sp. CFBP 8760]|uniref:aldose epimerase family protein n=1 Tax=Sphingomonas sp. CFBP 8760 TaxID=2775282 RepID=UPI00177E15B5|nr:aldose epimerase family protein [Sphingomonas sp. CFBP 8760]MBD8545309.1 galactose mutarotase [Sphingomonas sp. CFBP 8760]